MSRLRSIPHVCQGVVTTRCPEPAQRLRSQPAVGKMQTIGTETLVITFAEGTTTSQGLALRKPQRLSRFQPRLFSCPISISLNGPCHFYHAFLFPGSYSRLARSSRNYLAPGVLGPQCSTVCSTARRILLLFKMPKVRRGRLGCSSARLARFLR